LVRLLHVAMGSASELEVHLLLLRDLGLPNNPNCQQLAREVTKVKRTLTLSIGNLRAER